MFKYIILLLFLFKSVVNELLINKHEGAQCEWQGLNGTCAHVYQCRSSVDDIKKRNFPPICAFKGKEPIVCCTDCLLIEDARKVIYDPEIGELVTPSTKSEQNCYKFLKTLEYPCKKTMKVSYETHVDKKTNCKRHETKLTVLNQTFKEAQAHRFPSMAYLGYGKNMNDAKWLCGGTIISEKFILTAADCVNPKESGGAVKYVALGIKKRYNVSSTWQKYNVKRSILHPLYRPPSKYHDIALLETDIPIRFGANVFPACLDTGSPSTGPEVNSLTWTEGDDSTLDLVQLTEFLEFECGIFYSPQPTMTEGYNHTIQMCFGDNERPTDSCDMEIGSPLQSSFTSCTHAIRGVASIQRVCGEAGSSGLFTRVSYYVPWIESIVWP